ncbi:MAG: hypothetical protein M0012_07540 [Deltaproteobacteria bacterium]|nr:hypothetical protein [Deltaproteobacteria bacterium]
MLIGGAIGKEMKEYWVDINGKPGLVDIKYGEFYDEMFNKREAGDTEYFQTTQTTHFYKDVVNKNIICEHLI